MYKIVDKNGYIYLLKWASIRQGKYVPIQTHNYFARYNANKLCNELGLEFISENFITSEYKYSYRCIKCGYEFTSDWGSRRMGSGCPACAGNILHDGNRLSLINKELVLEWHPTKNGNKTPDNFSIGSKEKVWWICKNEHEWEAKINNRAINNTGCPYCYGRFATEENNLTITNPELMLEWDYEKNELDPTKIKRGSNTYAWWKCKYGHSWKAIIRNRGLLKDGRNCPICNKSKGEMKIHTYLEKHNIKFKTQKYYKGLIGLGGGNLTYDFYLPEYNLLIEYQGEFHDGSSSYVDEQFERQQEHDRRKKEYAKLHNINLLEIWYWDFDSIEEILNNYIIRVE